MEEEEEEEEDDGKSRKDDDDEEDENDSEGEEKQEECAVAAVKGRKKRTKEDGFERNKGERKNRKKTSIQSYLWDENESGKWVCKLQIQCGADGTHNKFHPTNMKRHWKAKHSSSLTAVERANEEGNDVKAVVKTLVNSALKPTQAVSSFFTKSPRHLASTTAASGNVVSGRVWKEVALL